MADKQTTLQVGPGFTGLLTIAFIVLKLTGHIDWSWIWVLSPLWIPLTLVFGILLIALTFIGVVALFGLIRKDK